MDSAEQAAGERQVRDLLVQPLMRRGLMRPAGMRQGQFQDMLADICARLAYMSRGGLMALEEVCASHPGGKARDRFPLGPDVLKWAADIEPPADSASPLIRAVFRHAVGLDAIEGGYAPELMAALRRERRWPSPFIITRLREQAAGPLHELARIEAALARGEDVGAQAKSFRQRRLAQNRKCQDIADLAAAREGRGC